MDIGEKLGAPNRENRVSWHHPGGEEDVCLRILLESTSLPATSLEHERETTQALGWSLLHGFRLLGTLGRIWLRMSLGWWGAHRLPSVSHIPCSRSSANLQHASVFSWTFPPGPLRSASGILLGFIVWHENGAGNNGPRRSSCGFRGERSGLLGVRSEHLDLSELNKQLAQVWP